MGGHGDLGRGGRDMGRRFREQGTEVQPENEPNGPDPSSFSKTHTHTHPIPALTLMEALFIIYLVFTG